MRESNQNQDRVLALVHQTPPAKESGGDPALRERAAQFETLLNQAPLGVYLVDGDLRIRLVNPVARPLFGNISNLIGRSLEQVVQLMWTREYAAELVRLFRHTLQSGESHEMRERMEYRIDRQATEYYEWRIERLTLPNGRYGVVCYFRDISDRKRTQEALRLNQERLAAALSTARMAFWEWKPKVDQMSVSANAADVFGLLPGETIERNADRFRLLHPEDSDRHRALVLRCAERGDGWRAEFRIIRPRDGQIAWLEERAMASRDPRTEEVHLTGLIWDITERKTTEAALRESEERFRTVANLGPDLLWSNDPAGYTIWVNQSWLEYTGQSIDEAIGYGWLDAVHPDDRLSSRHRFQAAIDAGADLQQEYRIRRADGQFHWFLVRAKPLRNETNRILGWFGSATNIDEFKRTQEALTASRAELQTALEQAQRAQHEAEAANATKDHFLATLSHELRTPLTPVLMTAESLLRRADLSSRVRDGLQMICRNIDVETHLIDDLLDLTRIAHGKFEMNLELVNVHDLVAAAVQVCEPDVRARQQVLTVRLTARSTQVRADPARLQQVFWNVLKNSAKFTPVSGQITLTSWDDSGYICIAVQDTGLGIEPGALPHLFEPFRQGDASITRRFGGVGLGLAIAKATVAAYDGTINASSDGLGRGATFTIKLPLANAQLPAPL
jgi:PAS domain S-box-containing protein